ncbi:MAG: hypothetical protein CMF74_05505 [Maricaulis sp.]|nr:hypothetical protein [Maricaulis sp.]
MSDPNLNPMPSRPDRRADWSALLTPDGPWLPLIYLGFFFAGWAWRPPAIDEALWSLGGVAVFLAVYVYAVRRGGLVLVPAAVVASVIGFAIIPWNVGGFVFLAFAGAMLARLPHSLPRSILFGILAASIIAAGLYWSIAWWLIAAVLAVAAMATAGSAWGVYRLERERQSAARQARVEAEATEAERQRIARDLHDLLGHTLTLVTLKADLAGKLMDRDPEAARRELADLAAASRQALGEVREAVSGLRHRPLGDALQSGKAALEAAGIKVHLVVSDTLPEGKTATVFAMAVRECVTNILRHAHAKVVRINFIDRGGLYWLDVLDDGRGGAEIGQGGLRGIYDRAEPMGGFITVENKLQGTHISMMLPDPETEE